MKVPTLREHVDASDAARFRGRVEQVRLFDRFLGPEAGERVLFVSGPGGIGKSALLREFARRARSAGRSVRSLDGRVGAIAVQAAAGEISTPDAVVIVDEADLLAGALDAVRDTLLDVLGPVGRIVLAARGRPHPSWRACGLDAILAEVHLGPVADDVAREILGARGVDGPRAAEIVAWAQGSPLALTVAASPSGGTGPSATPEELEQRLVAWLTRHTAVPADADLIDVAAIAPSVDARLLAAALPGRATREALADLFALPVVERVGGRAVLHAVLAAAVRERLRIATPERWATLRARVVRHLGARARLGDMPALLELSHFVDDPLLQKMISHAPGPHHYIDSATDDEFARLFDAHGFAPSPDRSELLDIAASARIRLVVRRTDREPIACAAFTPLTALEGTGAVAGALRDAARTLGSDTAATLVGVCLFAEVPHTELVEAARLAAAGVVARHGRTDVTTLLVHFPAPDRRPFPHERSLSYPFDGDLERPVVVTDFRPLDVAGFVEAQVRRDTGIGPRTEDAVRLLASSPDDPERRELLDRLFGSDDRDRRLRRALDLAHADPPATEAEALAALHVSRRTWFRLLREARERVASAGC